MHIWGELDKEGRDVCYRVGDAAHFIGRGLRRWARLNVWDCKEKFGTVRVYCCFGWDCICDVLWPGYVYVRHPVLHRLTMWVGYLNFLVIPFHQFMYRWMYKRAIKRWPELRDEILALPEYHELLEDL